MIFKRHQARPKRVLIVDRSEDNREVLRTALARRGMEILEAAGPEPGLALAREHHPEVIVLDLDTDADQQGAVELAFDAASRQHNGCLVVLGTARRRSATGRRRCVVPKPYHYGPLIRTIERMLAP